MSEHLFKSMLDDAVREERERCIRIIQTTAAKLKGLPENSALFKLVFAEITNLIRSGK